MDKRISELLLVFFVGFALLLTHYRTRMFSSSQENFSTIPTNLPHLAAVVPGSAGDGLMRNSR